MKTSLFNSKNYLGIGLVIILISAAFIGADFSGEWTLNEQKSTIGENLGRMASKKLKITQESTAISIERTGTNRNGETVTSNEKLTLDGKETDISANNGGGGGGGGNATRKVSAQWAADGKALTINSTRTFTRDGNTMENKTTENWSLSEDGKILTIDLTSTSQRGTNTMKLVYDKN